MKLTANPAFHTHITRIIHALENRLKQVEINLVFFLHFNTTIQGLYKTLFTNSKCIKMSQIRNVHLILKQHEFGLSKTSHH